MPSTPVTWLSEFTANLKTLGGQQDPVITQLANGNILIAWADFDDTGVGSDPGGNIIGRIFDAAGNPVTADILLAANPSATLGEISPEITALGTGGFLVGFTSIGSGTTFGYSMYDANGTAQGSNTVFHLDAGGAAFASGPLFASASSVSAMSIFLEDDGLASQGIEFGLQSIAVRIINPFTNDVTFAAPAFTVAPLGSGGLTDEFSAYTLAALSNGNYLVAAASHSSGGGNPIAARILDAAGAMVPGGFFQFDAGARVADMSSAALTGGNLAIAWNCGGAIRTSVYTNGGALVHAPADVNGAGQVGDEPAMAGLADGSFVVVWNDTSNDDILGQRFSATGAKLGAAFAVDSDVPSDTTPRVIALADGRFAVTWGEGTDIHSAILDSRDLVNSPVYTPAPQQIGTVGNDAFVMGATAIGAEGNAGNDTITGNALANTINGGDGNDTIKGLGGIDVLDGGAGFDTASFADKTKAIFVHLSEGADALVSVNGITEDTIRGFENFTGGSGNDTIIGDRLANVLSGGLGKDTISGGNGNDTVTGGAGGDTLDGSLGTDILSYAGSAAGVVVNLKTKAVSGGDAAGDIISNFENAVGSAHDDQFTGNDLANILTGGLGHDALTGGLGKDVFDFNAITESTFAALGRDVITDFNEAATDRIDLSTIDASSGAIGNNAFSFIGAAAFSGLGQVRVFQLGGNTYVDMNTTGTTAADMRIQLTGLHVLDGLDFIL